MTIRNSIISVEVATTEAARERGLSQRTSLSEGSGMLFVLDEDSVQGIWMKEMEFSIDIIWLDENKKVITIAHDVAPDTYPQVFYPTELAKYVLEVPAGFATAHDIKEGSEVALPQ